MFINLNIKNHLFLGMATYKPQAVQRLFTTASAFAALLADGSVVTWGDPEAGGDASSVQEKLKEVGSEGKTCGFGRIAKEILERGLLLLLLFFFLFFFLLFLVVSWRQVRHS